MRMIQEILGYFLIGLIGMAGLSIFYLPVYFLLRKRASALRQSAYFLLAGSVLIVLFATVLDVVFLKAAGGEGIFVKEHFINLIPFHFIREEWLMNESKKMTQVIANIFMFVPLGFLLPAAFQKTRALWKTTVCMALFSFSIEFVQYFIGRSADIDDLMLNTLGGMAGYGIFYSLFVLLQKQRLWRQFTGGAVRQEDGPVKKN